MRGAVGGVLLFHATNLMGRGPRPAARAALWVFTLSLVAYLFCQRTALLVQVPRPLVWGVLALCTSSTAWLWLAARGLFDDRFRWDWHSLQSARAWSRWVCPPIRRASRLCWPALPTRAPGR